MSSEMKYIGYVVIHIADTMWRSGLCRAGGRTEPGVQYPKWFGELHSAPQLDIALRFWRTLKALEKSHKLIIRFVMVRLAATR